MSNTVIQSHAKAIVNSVLNQTICISIQIMVCQFHLLNLLVYVTFKDNKWNHWMDGCITLHKSQF